MRAKKGKQRDEEFPLKLTVAQRKSLVDATRLTLRLKKKIKEAPADRQFIEFTKHELDNMDEEIYTSLAYVPSAHRKRLNAVLDQIDDLLDDLEGKQPKEIPRSVTPDPGLQRGRGSCARLRQSAPCRCGFPGACSV